MTNFDFYNPTHIIWGSNTINQLSELVPSEARVLILYGAESIRGNRTIAEVREALAYRYIYEFSSVESSPTYENLMKAVSLVRKEKITFLLAVGGQSVIDGTKFVSAASVYNDDAWRILETRGADIRQAMPFGTIPTLPSTGSEMNQSAVITSKNSQGKFPFQSSDIFPKFSIVDPSKTYNLSTRQLASGVADSFIHVIEQYFLSPINSKVQDRFAEGILQTLIEIGPQILKNSFEYKTYSNLMWTATLGFRSLVDTRFSQSWFAYNSIRHELTNLYGIDHARALAIILPAYMHLYRDDQRVKLLQYAKRVWHITEGGEEQRIDDAIELTRSFFESLGLPTSLIDYHLDIDDIDFIITHNQTRQA
tara:strand:- start:4851 stop:5945 length:1095 start_codon:yes stop_codon:yes gene_type:complete